MSKVTPYKVPYDVRVILRRRVDSQMRPDK